MIRCFVCFVFLLGFSTLTAAQTAHRDRALKEFEALRAKIQTLEPALLEVSAKERAALGDFPKESNINLIRLLPREKYDGKLTIRGGGAYYSFSNLSHEYGRGSDVGFEQGYLSVGFAGADYGIMAKLGEIALDSVTIETPAVQYLAQHAPPSLLSEARAEQLKNGDGVTVDNLSFKDRLTAIPENVYVLRSINYERSDVLVAFKIVKTDADGSLILAWKMLEKYPTPRLKRDDISKN